MTICQSTCACCLSRLDSVHLCASAQSDHSVPACDSGSVTLTPFLFIKQFTFPRTATQSTYGIPLAVASRLHTEFGGQTNESDCNKSDQLDVCMYICYTWNLAVATPTRAIAVRVTSFGATVVEDAPGVVEARLETLGKPCT
jgi:hypothetical protein